MTTLRSLSLAVCDFDPDATALPAVALRVDVDRNDVEQPLHRHRKGQLVLASSGGVTCEVSRAIWIVPPHHAVWIPGGMPHSNRVTDNARIVFLFVEPDAARLPEECRTLAVTPLVRELIQHLADQPQDYPPDGPTARLVAVLLEQLVAAPAEPFGLPMSGHPKIRRIARTLMADPADRTTLAQWARRLAMGERSLARLVKRETGLTFGRWRQQWHLIVALGRLAAGDAVREVAGQLGYESVTAFITMFKKTLGQPPAQYFAALRSQGAADEGRGGAR